MVQPINCRLLHSDVVYLSQILGFWFLHHCCPIFLFQASCWPIRDIEMWLYLWVRYAQSSISLCQIVELKNMNRVRVWRLNYPGAQTDGWELFEAKGSNDRSVIYEQYSCTSATATALGRLPAVWQMPFKTYKKVATRKSLLSIFSEEELIVLTFLTLLERM